jgi:chemotaxis protein MotA
MGRIGDQPRSILFDYKANKGSSMFVIIGFAVVLISVLGGFREAGGQFLVLIQPAEFMIIGGAAVGALLASAPKNVLIQIATRTIGALKGNNVTRQTYLSVLKLMYELLSTAQREGLIMVENHIEAPFESAIFLKYKDLLVYKVLISFIADTFRMVIIGGIGAHDLESMMEGDIDTHYNDIKKPSLVLSRIADTMPGLGIVAAILGIVITMQAIDGPAADLGKKVAAALVGTFLGILMCYGFFQPLASNLDIAGEKELQLFEVVKSAIGAFARGFSPLVCVEFARRSVPSEVRPEFSEMETHVKERN